MESAAVRRAVLILVLLLGTAFPALARKTLEITEIRPLRIAPEPPYVVLEVAYPRGFDQPEAAIRVNGQPGVFRPASGGYSQEAQYQSFHLYLGAPGPKEIQVTLTSKGKTLTASRRFDFQSRGDILPLEHFSGEGVFSPGPWRFYVYFLQDLRAWLNGREQPFSLTPLPNLPDIRILTVSPELNRGKNVLEIRGRNSQGEERHLTFAVVYLPERTARVGEVFWFPFGKMGSKSGPFYQLQVEGNSLQSLSQEFKPCLLLKDSPWLGGENLLCQELKAVAPGEATLKIFEKPMFLLGYSLKETVTLRVIP